MILVPLPDALERKLILEKQINNSKVKFANDVNIEIVATKCFGK